LSIGIFEIFEKIFAGFTFFGKNLQIALSIGFFRCRQYTEICAKPYRSIKAFQMQGYIDNCGCGYSTQGAIKNLFGKLDLYGMELDILTKRHSDLIHAAPIPPTSKNPFGREEIDLLWGHKEEEMVDTFLTLDICLRALLCYRRVTEAV
jgi:hypothetical protein